MTSNNNFKTNYINLQLIVILQTDNLNNNKVKLFVEKVVKSSGLFENSSIDVVFNSEKEQILSRLLSNSVRNVFLYCISSK